MRPRCRLVRWTPLLLLWWIGIAAMLPSSAAAKKPITHDVYDSWRSIQGTQLSRDGEWVVYTLAPQDGDGELVARNLRTGVEYRHPRGTGAALTADSHFLLFAIAPAKAERDRARNARPAPGDPPRGGLGILDLRTGAVVAQLERVRSFRVPEEPTGTAAANAARFVAYLMEPAARGPQGGGDAARPEPGDPPAFRRGQAAGRGPTGASRPGMRTVGSDLIVRDLVAGTLVTIPEVSDYQWNKDGSWLAYTVTSRTPANDGVFVRRTGDGSTRPLLTGRGSYRGLTFDETGSQLAFLCDRDSAGAETPTFKLYLWRPADVTATELVTPATPGVPAGMVVSDTGRLQFSRDGERLFLATTTAPRPAPKDAPEPLKVDIWNWKDPDLQTMQKVRSDAEKRRSYQAVVHLKEKRFVQLAASDMPNLAIGDQAECAVGTSDLPYRQLVSWDGSYSDVYCVRLQDGTRQKVLAKSSLGATLSPGGRFLLFFDAQRRGWCAQRLADGRRLDLTRKLRVRFQNEEWDTPDEPRPYGVAGWTADDQSVLVYDRYDIWELRPDGAPARNVTRGLGRAQHLIFRYQRLDPEERLIPRDKPLLLSARDDETKATGYYRVSLAGAESPTKLVMRDAAFGGLMKAKDADTLLFTLQRFDEFPDLWTSDGNFAGMHKISHANPRQAEFNWGRSELIRYRNADGKWLKAILTRPEDFDPARKYPLMVYIYEELTDTLHSYRAPSPGTSINISRYVSNGYVVLQPDIVYTTGHPGESAYKCVVPAVRTVVGMGFIDPRRIGIQGHSWGGYQISYLVTRTNLFRAAEAGASVVDMISAYGGIRWSSGMSRAFQYEKTQSRIGGPPWDYKSLFIENSPIFRVENVTTPYLTIHNDQDGAVPWYQGIEFFTALRRLGKEAYLFNYNGEDHGLRDRENQKHWTVHMAEFFDHYLKGAPRPEWMDRGVPYLERGTRDLTAFFTPAGATNKEKVAGSIEEKP